MIHILRQACGSLAEAHAQGLVHRDIKPANMFLTHRGGIPDFVKVLDFGLVKARNLEGQAELTGATATLGCVGYYLLTGEPVFAGLSVGEVLMHQVESPPEKPSVRLRGPVSPDLEELLMSCLAKKPAERPASADAFEAALAKCAAAARWTRAEADAWWQRRGATQIDKTLVIPGPQPK